MPIKLSPIGGPPAVAETSTRDKLRATASLRTRPIRALHGNPTRSSRPTLRRARSRLPPLCRSQAVPSTLPKATIRTLLRSLRKATIRTPGSRAQAPQQSYYQDPAPRGYVDPAPAYAPPPSPYDSNPQHMPYGGAGGELFGRDPAAPQSFDQGPYGANSGYRAG